MTGHDPSRVSPFGNPRIIACLAAPRGLSQPYYVLHRFLAPYHPPCTLSILTKEFVARSGSTLVTDTTSTLFKCQRTISPVVRTGPWTSQVSDSQHLGAGTRHGGEGDRTPDLLLAKQTLSQLSYTPARRRDADGPKWTRTTDLTLIRRAL